MMAGGLIALLINVVILCVVIGLIYWVVTQLLPEPFQKIARVVLIVLFVLLLLGVFFGGVQIPLANWRR